MKAKTFDILDIICYYHNRFLKKLKSLRYLAGNLYLSTTEYLRG